MLHEHITIVQKCFLKKMKDAICINAGTKDDMIEEILRESLTDFVKI